MPRGEGARAAALPSADDLVARARLGGRVSYAVADAATGRMLEVRDPLLRQPPASTAKALTALYALDALGPDRRLTTRLIATGPVADGRIEGDLVLAGGGDPTLDTDALADMAAALKAAGVREIAGIFRTWAGALPKCHEIDPEQPDHVGYNPAIAGLTLNYGRVHFEWARSGDGYAVTMDARSGTLRPAVATSFMSIVDRPAPVYAYAQTDGRDDWTVSRRALGTGGARWLPVRDPAAYAADVFATLARAQGIVLGTAVPLKTAPTGTVLVTRDSAPLGAMVRDMLKYSTNVTAEHLGLLATTARGKVPGTLQDSAGTMNAWLARHLGAGSAGLEDHSGLGDDSRISAADMAQAMVRAGLDGPLRGRLKPFALPDSPGVGVLAKTGTLNFVNALTGYADAPGDRTLAFAIFCSDVPRRDALTMAQRERPDGGRAWAGRARTLQRALLGRWGTAYAA